MRIHDMIIRKVRAYYQKQNRHIRRQFNENLNRYKYLTLFPYGDEDATDDPDAVACRCFYISFTNVSTPVSTCSAAHSRGRNNGIEEFIETPYANVFEKDIIISTSEIPELYISDAPLELLLNAPVLSSGELEHLSNSITSVLNYELPWIAESEVIQALQSEEKLYKFEVIREDVQRMKSRSGVELQHFTGYRTHRLVVNGSIVAFIEASGRELQSVKTVVLDEGAYLSFANHIIDVSGVRQYLDKPYVIMTDFKNVDMYVRVPGVSGIHYSDNPQEDAQ